MTKQEKIIVSAYTGVLMCGFDDLHEYIQKKLGRPVFTHELADKGIQKEVKEKSKEEFLEICKREENGRWIFWYEIKEYDTMTDHIPHCKCSQCETEYDPYSARFMNFCPRCGSYNGGEE